jgi:glycerol-3-phosphate dehydrogenase
MTRDYTLELEADDDNKAPLLSIFGGKITTYRKLSEAAMHKLAPYFPGMGSAWTAHAPMIGADFGSEGFAVWSNAIKQALNWLPEALLSRWIDAYGTRLLTLLEHKSSLQDLGTHFGQQLYQAEVDFLINTEWARSADDILWRRTKLGLYLDASQYQALQAYVAESIQHLGPVDLNRTHSTITTAQRETA